MVRPEGSNLDGGWHPYRPRQLQHQLHIQARTVSNTSNTSSTTSNASNTSSTTSNARQQELKPLSAERNANMPNSTSVLFGW